MMTKILLIRHATTDMVGKRLAGRLAGVHLNKAGRLQAKSLSERLEDQPVQAIYSSPMERAVETAEPVAALLKLSVNMQEAFTELDFGDWTNKTFEELRSKKNFQLFNEFRSVTPAPGGESMLNAQARMVTGILQLCKHHQGETIAVFSHSDMIKAAIAHYAGIPLDLMQRIEIDPASISIMVVYPETARITRLNDTGKLLL